MSDYSYLLLWFGIAETAVLVLVLWSRLKWSVLPIGAVWLMASDYSAYLGASVINKFIACLCFGTGWDTDQEYLNNIGIIISPVILFVSTVLICVLVYKNVPEVTAKDQSK